MNKQMRTGLWTAIAACAVLGSGCVGEEDLAGDEPFEKQSAIEIGTDDGDNPTRNAVVLLGNGCTGTLVAVNIVLTAAHCGWLDRAYYDADWHGIAPMAVFFGALRPPAGADPDAIAYQVSAPHWHTDDSGPVDIVLLKLAARVPETTAIPRPMYVDRPATLSSTSTIYQVGYGGGRQRRYMTGTNYIDWTTPGLGILVNMFGYTPTVTGPGIGDRGTNIEGGDSGGPMLLDSPLGYVIGDLSFWGPTGIATFGPGGDGRPSVREWLQAKVPQKPDFEIPSIIADGCTGPGGQPRVKVLVRNWGTRMDRTWVDVFHGRTSSPPIGTVSPIFGLTDRIAPKGVVEMSFAIPAEPGLRRIDVLVDTTRLVDEREESDNHRSALVELADCRWRPME